MLVPGFSLEQKLWVARHPTWLSDGRERAKIRYLARRTHQQDPRTDRDRRTTTHPADINTPDRTAPTLTQAVRGRFEAFAGHGLRQQRYPRCCLAQGTQVVILARGHKTTVILWPPSHARARSRRRRCHHPLVTIEIENVDSPAPRSLKGVPALGPRAVSLRACTYRVRVLSWRAICLCRLPVLLRSAVQRR